MTHVLVVIAPLFIIIFASAMLQRLTSIGDQWSGVLNDYALKVGFPVLIFTALTKTDLVLADHAGLLAVNSLLVLGLFAFGFLVSRILRLREPLHRTVFFCIAFGNVAYLGIPILVQVSGESIMPVASLIVAVYLFWTFTVGIGVLEASQHHSATDVASTVARRLLGNPLLIGVILGLGASALQLEIPGVIRQALDMITASVTPTVLIVIGLFIGRSRLGDARQWIAVSAFSLAKVMIVPAILFVSLRLADRSVSVFAASVIQAAMPVAITPFALADQYSLDKDFVTRSIVLSTVISVVSIPFWISLVQ